MEQVRRIIDAWAQSHPGDRAAVEAAAAEIAAVEKKADMWDMWEAVHGLEELYEFDNTLSAQELADNLGEVVFLEVMTDNPDFEP